MFWRDPNLYGASFPYKEFNSPVQTPFMGQFPQFQQFPMWHNMPRFVPQTFGFMPQYNIPQMTLPHYNLPYNIPQFNVPQFNVPQFNLPQYNAMPQFNAMPQYDIPQFAMPQYNLPYLQTPWVPQVRPFLPFDVSAFRPFI